MSINPKYFPIPNSDQVLVIHPSALGVFQTFAGGDLETGGLLFGYFNLPRVILDVATKPSSTDKRGRRSFKIDSINANREIKKQFMANRHFLGEWHSHPQVQPIPSPKDLFVKSKHELNAVVMVIVGLSQTQPALWVSLHNGKQAIPLFESEASKPKAF